MTNQTNKTGISLRIKLMGLTMGITAVLGVVAFGLLNFIDHKIKDNQKANFGVMAKNLGAAVEAQFYERYGDVQAFAINPQIQSKSKAEIVDALNNYAALYGIYDLILVVDAKGLLVAVNDKDPAGKAIQAAKLYQKDFSSEPWFTAALKGTFTEDKENALAGTFVENPQKDAFVTEVYGKDSYGNSFSTQIKDASGKVIGVVSNRAGGRWYETEFKNFYLGSKEQGFSQTEFYLVDSKGTFLFEYHPHTNKGVIDSTYDPARLFKQTYTESGGSKHVAEGIASGLNGSDVHDAKDMTTGKPETNIAGFATPRGPKMVKALGWGVIVEEPAVEAFAQISSIEKIFYTTMFVVLLAAAALAFFFSESLSKRLSRIATELSKGAQDVNGASDKINSSSISLSEASTEQAAAIQETAASIDEVSAMVKKNAENATHSREISQKSRQAAENGQAAVLDVINAIEEISSSNNEIMGQVHESNSKIEEIVHLIAEIGNKTKVINDIVFQTKLLSFNASVEAARAGEHGKGFAVVAEEVGNLAQMSGNAAKEISDMLSSSIEKVESIVRETKSKVDGLVASGKTKVELGTRTAKKCSDALDSILSTVQEVDSVVGEIATASKEQSQGVSEINKAMNQLDQTTQTNATVAQSSAAASSQLKAQSGSLKDVVSELLWLISGQVGETAKTSTSAPKNWKSGADAQSHHTRAEVISLHSAKTAKNHAAKADAHAAANKSEPSDNDPRFEAI